MGNPKSFGNLFEKLFLARCSTVPGLAITRFPDGCLSLGQNKVVRVKTPCDWILTYGGSTALIDTKTTEGDSFAYSKIKKTQIDEMSKHERSGARSGYVIWFRESDTIVFERSLFLSSLMNRRGSLKSFEGNFIGKSSDFDAKMIFGIN